MHNLAFAFWRSAHQKELVRVSLVPYLQVVLLCEPVGPSIIAQVNNNVTKIAQCYITRQSGRVVHSAKVAGQFLVRGLMA